MWNVFRKKGWAERRGDERSPAPNLDVCYATESDERQARVRDISRTGIYLVTSDRFTPGTDVELTFRGFEMDEDRPQLEVQLRLKAVRLGEDGIGLTFANDGLDAAAWSRLSEAAAQLTGDADRIRVLRTTKALAFLLRICPSAEDDILRLLSNKLSCERAARAVEIAMKTEGLLASRKITARTDLPSQLLVRILEDGPKCDEEQMRLSWAELLATSCIAGTKDASNLSYAGLLSRMDTVQVRVFTAACARAMRVGWETGFAFREDLHCSAEEIRKISHIQNMMGIERDLNHLFELGLLELTERPVLCAQVERVNMTPTFLALKLYARCHGQLEVPERFDSARLEIAS